MGISAEKTKLKTNSPKGILGEIKIKTQKLGAVSCFKYLGVIMSPPTKGEGEGGHIGFSVDPIGVCWHWHEKFLYPHFLNQLMEFHQTILDISLGQA